MGGIGSGIPKKKIETQCDTCAKPLFLLPWQLKNSKRHFCSNDCWTNAVSRTTTQKSEYVCPYCKKLLPRDYFSWGVQTHKRTGVETPLRRGGCFDCRTEKRTAYYLENREQERENHNTWKANCLEQGGMQAIRFYFKRHMASYSRRATKMGVPCTLTPEILSELYEKQVGCCYYTGVPMIWNDHHIGKKNKNPNAMSVDRLDNKQGYTINNVVLCTYASNTAKNVLTEQGFYDMCALVLQTKQLRESKNPI